MKMSTLMPLMTKSRAELAMKIRTMDARIMPMSPMKCKLPQLVRSFGGRAVDAHHGEHTGAR